MVDIPAANPFVLPVTVAESDIDPQGHASNVRIVGWMNRAATVHSDALGWPVERYQRLGGMWVVRRHEITYHRQAMLGDELTCYTWPSAAGKVTAERRHMIVRHADGELVAEGMNVWAFIDIATGRPKRIPPELHVSFDPANFL